VNREAVERITGSAVVGARPAAAGGYTNAIRVIAELADGRTVFVKQAGDDLTHDWLRAERAVYQAIAGSFMPELIGHENGILVLEDLSAAHWPPSWSTRHIAAVHEALAELHALTPPDGLPDASDQEGLRDGWETVASDPAPFLARGLCTPAWLERHLDDLREAAARAQLSGRASSTWTCAATISASPTAAASWSTSATPRAATRTSTSRSGSPA
jgi:hypothetical protein